MGKTKKEYKAIASKDFKSYLEKEKEKTMNCDASACRKDLWVQRDIMIKAFLKCEVVNFFL